MELFDMIGKELSAYRVMIDITDDTLTAVNPDNNNKLSVYREKYYTQDMKDCFVEYIVEFSTQHRHFSADEADEIIEYILMIISDTVLPLEFYFDGKRRFGGEIGKDESDKLSVSFLSDRYGCSSDHLMQFDYEIHSWSGQYDTGLKHVSDLTAAGYR